MTPIKSLTSTPPSIHTLWKHSEFMKLWTGQTISEFGTRITRTALSLAPVLMLGATPTQMGLLAATYSLPVLTLGLVAGAWVDRLPRRPILIVTDLGRALILLTMPLAAVLGILRIEQFFIVIALTGSLTVCFDVAYRSYLPSLVEREQIVEANSKLALSSSTAEVLGPGMAGVLIQLITAPIAIFFDALSFLVSAASLALIRKAEAPSPTGIERQHIVREIREGLRTVLHDPLLRATAFAAGTLSFFGNFLAGLYDLYAIRELGMGPILLGITITLGGIGSLVGSLLAERVVKQLGLGMTFISMMLLMGTSTLLIPLASGPLWLATMFLSLSQLGDAFRAIYFINDMSLRQTITPERLLGRVNASTQLLIAGVGPMGAIIGGVLGDAIGVRSTLFIAALGPFFACLWLLLSPMRVLRDRPTI